MSSVSSMATLSRRSVVCAVCNVCVVDGHFRVIKTTIPKSPTAMETPMNAVRCTLWMDESALYGLTTMFEDDEDGTAASNELELEAIGSMLMSNRVA